MNAGHEPGHQTVKKRLKAFKVNHEIVLHQTANNFGERFETHPIKVK